VNIAVIDIGTNTVLLLLAEITDEGRIHPLLCEQRIPRLGKGVDATRKLQRESIDRVVRVLREYLEILSPSHLVSTILCGTSALRDASNRADFTGRVQSELGLSVEILSGEDEALLTYRGALSGLPGVRSAVVLDIGGGSTEISAGDAFHVRQKWSLDIGSVRLTERFFRHDPPAPEELGNAIRWVRGELGGLTAFAGAGHTLIGVAGTATTLAVLDQGLQNFDIEAVSNYRLTREAVEGLFIRLKGLSHAELLCLTPALRGRADVITAGTLILKEVMDATEHDDIVVSERGVRYGIALREWQRLRGRP
jgi:exopolyphosphatase/guanosine-5'-triphosphate,3'-diphosphate pyrophosphatase